MVLRIVLFFNCILKPEVIVFLVRNSFHVVVDYLDFGCFGGPLHGHLSFATSVLFMWHGRTLSVVCPRINIVSGVVAGIIAWHQWFMQVIGGCSKGGYKFKIMVPTLSWDAIIVVICLFHPVHWSLTFMQGLGNTFGTSMIHAV